MDCFWTYLAGLIDGEGCFQLLKHKSKQISTGYAWQAVMDIGQCNHDFLVWLQKRISQGGIVSEQGRLTFSSNAIRSILPRIIPFLGVKREQAIILQKALFLLKHRCKRYRDKNTDVQLEKYAEELKKLKHSG